MLVEDIATAKVKDGPDRENGEHVAPRVIVIGLFVDAIELDLDKVVDHRGHSLVGYGDNELLAAMDHTHHLPTLAAVFCHTAQSRLAVFVIFIWATTNNLQ